MDTEIIHAQDQTIHPQPHRQPSSLKEHQRQHQVDAGSQHQDSHSQSPTSPGTGSKLSHPPWTTLITRIPRAARASVTALLSQILKKIIADPNNKTAWHELLHFGPLILSKPKRGGSKRNLSNVVKSRVAAWDKDMVSTTNLPTVESKPTRKLTENSNSCRPQAAAVSTKLEAGNFRAAIRIICSSDTPAQANQDTLNALHAKHPAAAQDRRTIIDPGDNPRFDALQVSREDVMRALRTFPLGSSGEPDGISVDIF